MTDIIEHGIEPNTILDETGLNLMGLNLKGSRRIVDKEVGGRRVTVYRRYENAKLAGSLKGEPIRTVGGAYQGLCVVHPGIAVALLNLPNSYTIFGFAFTAATKVLINDPSLDITDTKEDQFDIPFEFLPGIDTDEYSAATS